MARGQAAVEPAAAGQAGTSLSSAGRLVRPRSPGYSRRARMIGMRLPSRPAGLLALTGALALAPSGPAVAATIAVNTTADETVPDGHCSLREAISAANGDSKGPGADCANGSGADTVKLAKGHFTRSIEGADDDRNDLGDFDIRSTVTIVG